MTIETLMIGAIGLVALAVAATYLLPRHVHVERTATLDAAPGEILALARSNRGYQKFNPYLTADPALKIAHFGPETGIGSGFRFDGKDGKGSQTVSSLTQDTVAYRIDLGAIGKPRQSISAVQGQDGTRVTWRMHMDLGLNPVARVFGLFLENMVGKTFEQGLENLATAT